MIVNVDADYIRMPHDNYITTVPPRVNNIREGECLTLNRAV